MMKLSDKEKVYDKIRTHILSSQKALGTPPQINIPCTPDIKDFDSVRGFYKALKDNAVEFAEWYAKEKEISEVKYIFELAGEDMSNV